MQMMGIHGIASHEIHYVEWNLQAERRCPQDDGGWLIIRQQGNKVGVTVQHRVIIAPEMNVEPQGRSKLGLGEECIRTKRQ
jgi:hypothetical protein